MEQSQAQPISSADPNHDMLQLIVAMYIYLYIYSPVAHRVTTYFLS